MRLRREILDGFRNTVCGDLVVRIKFPNKLHAPIEKLIRIIDAELQPIEALGIACKSWRRLYLIPRFVAVAMPDVFEMFERIVFFSEPFAELVPGGIAEAVHPLRGTTPRRVLVPEIVSEQPRMIAVAFDQCGQEILSAGMDIRVVKAEPRIAAGFAACRNCALDDVAIVGTKTRMRIFLERPLRSTCDHLGDDDLDVIFGGEVEHLVVAIPVIFAGRSLDDRPHEPMPEGIHADVGCGLVIASPIGFRRVRLAEVDGAIGKHGRLHLARIADVREKEIFDRKPGGMRRSGGGCNCCRVIDKFPSRYTHEFRPSSMHHGSPGSCYPASLGSVQIVGTSPRPVRRPAAEMPRKLEVKFCRKLELSSCC